MMKRLNRRYTKDERFRMIELALSVMAQKGIMPEATAYEIADKIQMYPGKNLYLLLSEMVTLGRLTKREVQHRPNKTKSLYSLPEGTYTLPAGSGDTITINGVEYERKRLL